MYRCIGYELTVVAEREQAAYDMLNLSRVAQRGHTEKCQI